MIQNYNITNAQVLEYIKIRLYEILNKQSNINFEKSKNKKIEIVAKIFSYLLLGLSAVLILSTLLAPMSSIGTSLLIKLIWPTAVGLLGGVSLAAGNTFSDKKYQLDNGLHTLGEEATMLQQVREYINGNISITKDIEKNLNLIQKQIYIKEETQYRDNSQNPIATSDKVNYSNPNAIETPFVVQGSNILEFAKNEYKKLKTNDFLGDASYFIRAIDNGKYNNYGYTQAVLVELRNIAVQDIAQGFYDSLTYTYALTPDMIISNVKKGLYNNRHLKEVLAEVINIANYNKKNESAKRAV